MAEECGMSLAKTSFRNKRINIMTADRVHVEKKLGVLGDKCQIKFRLDSKTQTLKF